MRESFCVGKLLALVSHVKIATELKAKTVLQENEDYFLCFINGSCFKVT